MSSSIRIALVFCLCIAVSVAFDNYVGFDYNNGFSGFGGSSGNLMNLFSVVRDPRQNTGPVLFPPSPPEDGSGGGTGVIPGASGYGFVAPGGNPIPSSGDPLDDWLNSLSWGSYSFDYVPPSY